MRIWRKKFLRKKLDAKLISTLIHPIMQHSSNNKKQEGEAVDSSITRGKHGAEQRERRRVSRTSTKAQAFVSREGMPRFKGKVRDLSSTGVFVATGPLPIREQHVVKLNLILDLGTVVRLHNRPAIVIRRSREGVALKFF